MPKDLYLGRLTDINAAVLHFFPVFQVHGPDVSIKETRWVRNSVVTRTANIKMEKNIRTAGITLLLARC